MTAGTAVVLRRLLVVAAALVLLGHGAVEVAPRLTSAGATVVSAAGGTPTAGRPASSRPAAESQPVDPRAATRTGLGSAVAVPTADTAGAPATGPLVAQHLEVRPVVRPPTSVHDAGAAGAVDGRAPPGGAGT